MVIYLSHMRLKLQILYVFAILAIFGFFAADRAFAVTANDIIIKMMPDNPAPNENVVISLNSYAVDLDSTRITWTVNGRAGLTGIGEKNFTAKAGPAGSETFVNVNMEFPEEPVDIRIVLRPNTMVMLWQAVDSYVPPFYKGKALATQDSTIKIIALPEIKSGAGFISPKNMTYAWKLGYSNDQGASGYGKNVFTFDNDYLESGNNVSVTATTVDQTQTSSGSIDLQFGSPKILFYKKDKKLGTLWSKTIEDGFQIGENEAIDARPYFLSPKVLTHPSIVWGWSIDENPIFMTGYIKNVLLLKKDTSNSGSSRLRLEIENSNNIFQKTSKEINIKY